MSLFLCSGSFSFSQFYFSRLQILNDEKRRTAVFDEAGGDAAVGPVACTGIAMRAEQNQIHLGFINQVVQGKR
jgi:hypothetical protein